jgi:hypothetical protein
VPLVDIWFINIAFLRLILAIWSIF